MNGAMEVRWMKLATKIQLCVKCKDLVKVFLFRSGVVSTPEVGMKHVDRHWKAYPVGNKDK